MEELVVVGKGLLKSKPCDTTSSCTQTPNVLRRSRTRVRRHLLHANRMSCPLEYGEYQYPYLYVYGGYGDMEGEEERQAIPLKPITVGVCAMKNKVQAPPMQSILDRIKERPYICIVTFSDKVIIESSIEDWPVCDCLIAFYSKGFPLEKAIKYVELRKPLVFNDLGMQYSLMDRIQVYKVLNANGIETPEYEVVNRNSTDAEGFVLSEADDILEINGMVFHKPFVEKPVSAENHNIYIYFPSDFGGGSQRLFRKVKNRSSSYSDESSIRTEGSYIYEEFLATDGTDVKVYTVGPDYAHAEARKSPALDGKVERDENGKEVRYPVILTAKEKLIARAVCLAFKQTVCGFDLLRANGKSYVCDVNGFSFVKNSQKYYDDCAQILLEMITINLCPQYFPSIPPSVDYLMEEFPDMPVPIPRVGNNMELRCVVGMIRHGDRTPKQKMKMIVKHKRFFDLFKELNGYETGQVKIKKPKLLQRVLDISRVLLGEHDGDTGCEIMEKKHKLEQLRSVLEMYGTFTGINRKLQLKLLSKKDENEAPRLLLILKWGGEQTLLGQNQAEELGRAFRIIYPGGEGEYASLPGSGFLRLHSTYRHDLKVYASDEGRVQMTAAAFTKGLLDLEGNPASVLVHLVKRDQAATNMLDTSTVAQNAMNRVKEHLHGLMRSPDDFNDSSFSRLAPEGSEQIRSAMEEVCSPRDQQEKVYTLIQALMKQLRSMFEQDGDRDLYHGETLQQMVNRWSKLEKDFKQADGKFDISKIPDIYDCIKYDLLHNRSLNLAVGEELFRCVMPLADIVMPQEYGITKEEKLDIAHKICKPILTKIQADFHHTIVNETTDVLHRLDHRLSKGVISPKRHVRTRLYFTSESHVHCLTNLLKHDNLIMSSDVEEGMENLRSVPELNYMTQIVFLLFEDCSKPEDSDLRYRVTIHFSPGVRCRSELLVNPSEVTDGASDSVTPSGSPSIPAPIHSLANGENQNGTASQLSMASEDASEWRPKEVHIVRRYSENSYPAPVRMKNMTVPSSFPPVWTTQPRKLPLRKISIPASFPPISWVNVAADDSLKSHSEAELTNENMAQKSTVTSRTLPVFYSSLSGILESTVHSQHSQTHLDTRSVGGDSEEKTGVVGKKQGVHFTVGGEENSEEESSGQETGRPASTKNLRDPPRSVGAMSGLVLATDLVCSIYQLTPVASIPLSRMNNYLSGVTGVPLKYDLPQQKDPPCPYRRSPSYRNVLTSDSTGSVSPQRTSTSNASSQTDLYQRRISRSPLKDSMEAMEQVSRVAMKRDSMEITKSDTNVDTFSDSTLDASTT